MTFHNDPSSGYTPPDGPSQPRGPYPGPPGSRDWPPPPPDRADPFWDPPARNIAAEPSLTPDEQTQLQQAASMAADRPDDDAAWQDASRPANKAGRNLPLAIAVGLVLGAVVLLSLLVDRRAFLAVIAVAVGVGVWELGQAMRHADIRVPTVPLIACGLGMLALTWFGGPTMLAVGMGVTVMVLVVWRLADGATNYHVDVPASVLVAAYVPLLGGFAVLMLSPVDGHLRIIATLAIVVLSDTGGYVAGVLAGRHPMAPKISPKKSWEGLAGSLFACAIGGALLMHFMFDVVWWAGVCVGVTMALAGTLGDLTESLIKRDLGVKDMSNLIPGHGGLMDRLDSILLVLPVAFAWLAVFAPASSS